MSTRCCPSSSRRCRPGPDFAQVVAGRSLSGAGKVTDQPAQIVVPVTTADVVRVVRTARRQGQRVKAVGAWHPSNPMAATDGVAVNMGRHRRVLDIDREAGTVTVQAGIRLRSLAETLAARGLALANQGDSNAQSLGGALSTAAHGTGARVGGLATFVRALDLVLADGSVVHASPEEEPELFAAARVGLGALGVVLAVTLSCVPAFNLRSVEGPADLGAVLAGLDDRLAAHDHYEWSWIAPTRRVRTTAYDRTELPPGGRGMLGELRDREPLANVVGGRIGRAEQAMAAFSPALARMVAARSGAEWVGRSDRVLSAPRLVPVAEMEYALPRSALAGVMADLVAVSDARRGAPWVRVRFAPADDIPLSTAYGRQTAYVAVAQHRRRSARPRLEAAEWEEAEAIFVAAAGRPQWGTIHSGGAAILAPRYPGWDAFASVRRRVDPDGLWSNDYLDRVLGPVR